MKRKLFRTIICVLFFVYHMPIVIPQIAYYFIHFFGASLVYLGLFLEKIGTKYHRTKMAIGFVGLIRKISNKLDSKVNGGLNITNEWLFIMTKIYSIAIIVIIAIIIVFIIM